MRKAKYGDIAILLRATKGYAECFVDELSNQNIPVFADINTGYFENREVQVMLALLKIIDNPYQDIPLVAVLRSKIGDFNVNELTDIRFIDQNCSYYEAMQKAAGQGNQKVLQFLEQLSRWREKSQYLRLGEFIALLYQETNYYDYVSVMPNGSIRKNNLEILLNRAEQYDSGSYKGLFHFLNFMDNLRETSGDMGSSKALGDQENVVRIMSIHKSKGLEFPVVFLCGTARKFNQRDTRNAIILHQEEGFGADVIHLDKRITYESIPKLALKQKMKEESLSEELRILYVALTRAREKLIVTCLTSHVAKKIEKWSAPQTAYSVANSKCFADWIGGTIFSHENDWDIHEWSYADVLRIRHATGKEEYAHFIHNIETQFQLTEEYTKLEQAFQWQYPYADSTRLPSKMTVTELKKLGDESFEEEGKENSILSHSFSLIPTPQFLQENQTGGAQFGTLLHHVMQRVSFDTLNDESILLTVEEKYRKRLQFYLKQFAQSSLCQEIRQAKNIYREMPFNLSLPFKEVYGDAIQDQSKQDQILIQGVIDLYFETQNGNLVLVDYKTDVLDTEQAFIQRYQVQLQYYQKALEALTGKKVEKVIIYSFHLHKEIVL